MMPSSGSRMYSDTTVLKLIDVIYAAAMDVKAWTHFLDMLAETIDGHHVALSVVDTRLGKATYVAASRSDPTFISEYQQHFATRDPWVKAGKVQGMLRPGVVDLGEHLLSHAAYKQTEFFNELGRRYGFIGGFAGMFGDASYLGGLSGSQRTSGDFGPLEVRLIQTLLPHVQRSFELQRRLETAEHHCRSLLTVLDHTSKAAILVNGLGCPVFVNAAALRILNRRDGLLSTRDGLSTNNIAETQAFRELIRASMNMVIHHGSSTGGVMRLSRKFTKHPLHVLVSRLHGSSSASLRAHEASAVVFLYDPEENQKTNCEHLAKLFRLTEAEARVGAMLAFGSNVREVAEQLKVSTHTVRTHVKHLLGKTDTRSQAQLVGIIVASLASLDSV